MKSFAAVSKGEKMSKGEIARNYFLYGYNCSASVVLAFKDEMEMDEEELKKLAIGFGGGLARRRLTCGAVSGMVMVLGKLLTDGENKAEAYEIINRACDEFESETGSLICGELLKGVTVTKGTMPEERTVEYYKKRPCAELVLIAADITEKALKGELK